jgi:cytochrome c-type biogenesis protein CcsB
MTVELGVTLFRVAFSIYLGATICYALHLFAQRDAVAKAGSAFLIAGLLVHTGSLVVRTMAAHRMPFLNLYEYMLSLTWGAVVVYLALELLTKSKAYGSFVVPLVAAFAFMTMRLPSEVNPTMPALESAWRTPHIGTAILAYSAFAAAFGVAIMYMLAERSAKKDGSFWATRLPSMKTLDRTIYRTIAFGFLMQTLLIITGAIWAERAWGSYWSWDPKETWALITWLIYAVYLHTRTQMGWQGRKSAIMAIIGFVAVAVTLAGVFFLKSLHSYS